MLLIISMIYSTHVKMENMDNINLSAPSGAVWSRSVLFHYTILSVFKEKSVQFKKCFSQTNFVIYFHMLTLFILDTSPVNRYLNNNKQTVKIQIISSGSALLAKRKTTFRDKIHHFIEILTDNPSK